MVDGVADVFGSEDPHKQSCFGVFDVVAVCVRPRRNWPHAATALLLLAPERADLAGLRLLYEEMQSDRLAM